MDMRERWICLRSRFLGGATVVNLNRTKSFLFDLKCTKIAGGWGFAPDPAGGAFSAPPDPLAVRREGRAGQGRGGEGRGGQGRAGQGKAGQGRAGQGRAGQGRAGQGRAGQAGRGGQGRGGEGTLRFCPPNLNFLATPLRRCPCQS